MRDEEARRETTGNGGGEGERVRERECDKSRPMVTQAPSKLRLCAIQVIQVEAQAFAMQPPLIPHPIQLRCNTTMTPLRLPAAG